jgi:hypothetical protein
MAPCPGHHPMGCIVRIPHEIDVTSRDRWSNLSKRGMRYRHGKIRRLGRTT